MDDTKLKSDDQVSRINGNIPQLLNRCRDEGCDVKHLKSEADALLKMFQTLPPECHLEDLQVEGLIKLCLVASSQLAILSKVKKVWQLTRVLFHQAELSLPSTEHQFSEFFRVDTWNEDGERHTADVDLLSISNLLEVKCIIPEWLELHGELLADLLMAKLKVGRDTSTDEPFLISKVLMQICQLQAGKIHRWSERREDDARMVAENVIAGLLRITCGKSFTSETCHMSSVALMTFLKSVSDDESSLTLNTLAVLDYLFQGTNSSRPIQDARVLFSSHSVCIPELPHLGQSEYVFGVSCYCRAVLKVLDARILLLVENDPCMLERILEVICSLQNKKQGTEYHYILLITTLFETLVLLIGNNQPWQPSDTFWPNLERLAHGMWCEVSSPIAGAQEQLMKAYRALINMLHIETGKGNLHAIQMHQRLLQSVLSAPFHVKARYLIVRLIIQFFRVREALAHRPELPEELMGCMDTNHLRSVAELEYRSATECPMHQRLLQSVLSAPFHVKARYLIMGFIIQFFGVREVLSHRPELPDELMRCMDTNHLRSVAELVYRQALQDLKKRLGKEGEELLEEWNSIWSDKILTGLCSEISLSRSHVCNYFISHTLKTIPGSLPMLLSSVAALDGVTEARKLHASIMILKQAKMRGLLKDTGMVQYEPILQAGLSHLDDDIRSDAFGLLVHSWHSCQPFSGRALVQLRDFIFDNLDSDNTAFRNNFITGVKNALHRIRDSSPQMIRKLNLCNSENDVSDSDKDEIHRRLSEVATFLDEVFERCLSSLFPGACYQRVRSALDILTHLFQCFMTDVRDKRKEKKGISEEMKLALLSQIQVEGKCLFICARSASLLLPCLLESSSDLRASAYHLLTTHFPWPLPHSNAYPWPDPTEVLTHGMKLVSSPRVKDGESGALLCKMSFTKNIIEKNIHMRDIYPKKSFEEPNGKSRGGSTKRVPPIFPPKHPDPVFHFLHSLLDSLKFQFEAFQEDVLIAATVTPMYGLVIALNQCIVEVPETLTRLYCENQENARAFIRELLDTLHRVCRFVLKLLSGRSENSEENTNSLTRSSPSVDEMIDTITRMMTSPDDQSEGLEDGDLLPSGSPELIFSCSWLSLKHCGCLLSQISAKICRSENIKSLMETSQHIAVATVLVDILVQCRHTGVIENCAIGLSSLCSAFLSSVAGSDLQAQVQTLLEMTFDLIVGRESSYSKKSAGLPMLVEAIVTAEPRRRERRLLKFAVTRLLEIAKEPLPEESSEKQDLPQAHALNILGSLFRASATAEDIGPYLSEVLQFAIRGFASPCFVLRNCCMQLFGILIARLFGQKKVTDEHSVLNSLSVEEFFSRHGDMKDYLLSEVVAAAENLKSKRSGSLPIGPSLQPVLVVLSRLGPGMEGQYDESLSKPFRDSLLVLLSSPIYFVRRLVRRAILAFIPVARMVDLMGDLIRGLPQSFSERACHNRIHGELLLIEELINSGNLDKESLQETVNTLSDGPSWIGQALNHCAFTRAAYLNILRTAITRTRTIPEGVKNVSEAVMEQCSSQQELLYRIGAPELCDAVVGLAFDSSKLGSGQGTSLTQIIVRLLAHPSQDMRLSAIKSTEANLQAFSDGKDLRVVAESVFQCVMTETSHTNLSESLNLCYSLCLKARSISMNWDVPQWPAMYSSVFSLANGSRGSLLSACSLPLLSCLGLVDAKRCIVIDWREWLSLLTTYCELSQSETLRFAVVRSLNVAAGECFAALASSGQEEDAVSAVSLLQCIYRLLQDEQSGIRRDTAEIVNELISGNSFESRGCSQVNHMLQRTILYFCDKFSWSQSVPDLLFAWLQGSSLCDLQERLNIRSSTLFEQISSNIYREPVIEADFLAAGLEAFLLKMAEQSPEFVESWLKTKYKRSVEELKTVEEALGKISLVDGSFFGVTGFRKPYQSVYKVHRSLLLLHAVSRQLGMVEALEIHRKDLKDYYDSISQKHHIHPLLQDARLLPPSSPSAPVSTGD